MNVTRMHLIDIQLNEDAHTINTISSYAAAKIRVRVEHLQVQLTQRGAINRMELAGVKLTKSGRMSTTWNDTITGSGYDTARLDDMLRQLPGAVQELLYSEMTFLASKNDPLPVQSGDNSGYRSGDRYDG